MLTRKPKVQKVLKKVKKTGPIRWNWNVQAVTTTKTKIAKVRWEPNWKPLTQQT